MNLVVGSTGYVGGEICRRLRAAGKPVRAFTRVTSAAEKIRNLESLGCEIVTGDLREPATLRAACQGVETVFTSATTTLSMQPGDSIPVTDQQGQLDLVKAAREAGVGRFVMVSIPQGILECPLTTAKRAVEQAIITSGMAYTILRPPIFMEIWLSPALGFDYVNGKATIYGDGHAQTRFISLGDVAEYAVRSLDNPAACDQVLDIGQPQTYSYLEVVRIFEKLAGKSFELQFVPAAALEAQRSAATDPLQNSFATLMLGSANGIRTHPEAALKAFAFPLVSLEAYARQALGVGAAQPV